MSDVHPFSNGTQYGDWTEANCDTCSKRADRDHPPETCPCDIEQALLYAYVGTGTISADIADRMGRSEGRYNWPCKEHDPPFTERRA